MNQTPSVAAPAPPGRARLADLAALLAGCAYPLGFAPFGWWPVTLLSLACLVVIVAASGGRRAFRRGWLWGLGAFGVGVSWIQVSVHQFGLPVFAFSAGVTVAFVAFIAVYPGLFAWLVARLTRVGPVLAIPATAAAWTVSEGLRGVLLTGFPWLQAGYSQVDAPLAGYAPVLGVLGVGFLAALLAALLAQLLARPRALPVCAGIALVVLAAGAALGRVEWTTPSGPPRSAALMQGSVPQAIKWLPAERAPTLALYRRLAERHAGAQLLVWPETALPAFPDEITDYLAQLDKRARARGQGILIGMPSLDREDPGRYYNAVLAYGAASGSYRKHHLVPFGEYLPLKPLLGRLLDFLAIPMSDFSAGPASQAPIRIGDMTIGVSICYEDAYGGEVVRALPEAGLLVNVSNDAWFGDSLAPHQHEEIARMRALETGRDLIRATNNGVSSFIDYRGRILARSRQFETTTLAQEVQPRTGATPYVAIGGWPVPLLAVLLLGLAEWRGRGRVAISKDRRRDPP